MNIGSDNAALIERYRLDAMALADTNGTQTTVAASAGAASRAALLGNVPTLEANTTPPRESLMQRLPQLAAPNMAAAQALSLTDVAQIASPLAQGSDAVGNAFVGVLTQHAAEQAQSSQAAGFMMDDAKIDVLLLMSAEWQKSQIADRALESKMTSMATQAATYQSESQITAGQEAFTSALSGSALNVGMQLTGATVRIRALNKEHASLKINTQNGNDSHGRQNAIDRAVRAAEAVRPSDVETVTVGHGSSQRTLRLEEDMVRAPASDAARLSETANMAGSRATDMSTQHALNQRAWGRDYAKADLWRTGADVSAKMVDGMGQMAQSKEHAHQTVDQNQQDVSRGNASLHEESARQSRAIAQEMHTITNQLISNIGSVAAQVAGNLRV
jgi:invasin C